MSTSKYNILPYHKQVWRRRLFFVFVLVGTFLIGLLSGQVYTGQSIWDALVERDQLSSELNDARSMIRRMKKQISIYENARQVDQQTVKNTQDDLRALQARLVGTEKELEFYRRIISPEDRNYELKIQSLRLFKSQKGQQLALTLSQGIGRDSTIRATANIQFRGRLNGKKKVLKLKDVHEKGQAQLNFSFRYFQTMTAIVKYPEGFELASITVFAEPHTKRREKISRTWKTEELVTESALSDSLMSHFLKLN